MLTPRPCCQLTSGCMVLSPGWDLPLVMGHLGGQMKLRLDECFLYYGYGALWRHWQLHIDSLLSRRPTSAVVLFPLSGTRGENTELWILAGISVSSYTFQAKHEFDLRGRDGIMLLNVFIWVINLFTPFHGVTKGEASTSHTRKINIFANCKLRYIRQLWS